MRILTLIAAVCISFGNLLAQTTDDFVPGKIVNAAGDTVEAEIKIAKDYRYQKSVTVIPSGSEDEVKYTPKELTYFTFNEREFVSTTIDGKKVFVERIIGGDIDLYLLITREKKSGKYQSVETYYIRKESETEAIELNKTNFKKEVLERIPDNEELYGKVDTKYYTYAEKEAVIEEYNQWVKLGRPGTSWTKEAGNYTIEEETPKIQPKKTYDPERYGPRFGIDITGMATYNFVNYPDEITVLNIFPSNGGFGYNAGFGFRARLTPTLSARVGMHFWNKKFNATFIAVDTGNNYYNGLEKGDIKYLGAYAMIEYEMGRFFIQGGFDVSFANWYTASYRLTKVNDNSISFGDDGVSDSFLARKFSQQLDFIFGFGYRIPIANGRYNLKPNFQYTIPLMPLWRSWAAGLEVLETYNYNVSAFLVQLGITFDFGLGKGKDQSKL